MEKVTTDMADTPYRVPVRAGIIIDVCERANGIFAGLWSSYFKK